MNLLNGRSILLPKVNVDPFPFLFGVYPFDGVLSY